MADQSLSRPPVMADQIQTDWNRRRGLCHEAGKMAGELKRLGLNVPGTPRWNQRLEAGIKTLEGIARHNPRTSFEQDTAQAYVIRDDLVAHWKLIYGGDPFATSRLYSTMEDLHNFLRYQLTRTYADGPGQTTPWLIYALGRCHGSTAEQQWAVNELNSWSIDPADVFSRVWDNILHHPSTNSASSLYHCYVDLAVREMCLNPDHVQQMLTAAAMRPGPGSDIEPLIESRRWGALAETLILDHQMADDLFWDESSRPTEFGAIIAGINRVTSLYFDRLESISDLKISSYAESLDFQAADPPPAYAQESGPADATTASSTRLVSDGVGKEI